MLQEDGKLPDLILIDGGKGQLKVADEVLQELQLADLISLVAVSKGAARRAGDEQLHRVGKRALRPGGNALRLIQRIRDEAHRFAITAHRHRRARRRRESPLQQIPGIGEARRRSLLRHFGGIRELRRAGVEDLAKVPNISSALARRIYDRLHG